MDKHIVNCEHYKPIIEGEESAKTRSYRTAATQREVTYLHIIIYISYVLYNQFMLFIKRVIMLTYKLTH